jgi:hypothetical protein
VPEIAAGSPRKPMKQNTRTREYYKQYSGMPVLFFE